MAEDFNSEEVKRKQDLVINGVRKIRDGLDKDIVLYYRNLYPDNEEENKHYREVMRNYLHIAKNQIDHLLNGDLY